MTILGQHTVAETRDFIRATEFRVNKNLQQLQKIQGLRSRPFTPAQQLLDKDMAEFIREWVEVRDKQTVIMTAAVLANPSASPFILPAEKQFQAIADVQQKREPHFKDIEQRIGVEAASLSLPPLDLSGIPKQDSPDADFAALKKLDAAIKSGEQAAKETAKSNTGLIIAGGVVGVLAIVVATKVYL